MAANIEELPGLEVQIDDLIYMPELDAPTDRPHPFVYFISIRNNSPEAVTVRGRKWVITQENGERIVVEGDGVVSQFPRIEPGGVFTYNSYHVVGMNSSAAGSFFAETDGGRFVFTRIPNFEMRVPSP